MIIADTGSSYYENPGRTRDHQILADPVFERCG
jgi:hypothetical protein